MSPLSSFKVLGGPLDGRELVLLDDVNEVLIGRDAGCQLRLDLPAVSPIHARVRRQGGAATVFEAGSPGPIYVNDDVVRGRAPLRHGDILWLGAPGEPQSVMIQCRLAPPAAPPASPSPQAVVEDAPQHSEEAFFIVDAPEPTPSAAEVQQLGPVDEFLVTSTPSEPESADLFFVDQAPVAEQEAADGFFIAEPEPVPPAAAASGASLPAAGAGPGPAVLASEPASAEAPTGPAAAPPRRASSMPAKPVAAGLARPSSQGPPAPHRSAAPSSSARARVGREARRPPAPSRRRAGTPFGSPARYLGLAVGLLVTLGVAGLAARRVLGVPRLESVSPSRAKVGQLVTLAGSRFQPGREGNRVLFDERAGTVLQASATQIQAEVPELPTTAGRDVPVKVRVEAGGRTTGTIDLAVYQSPRIHGVSPDVAMPGDELTLAGSGWGPGATVHFGSLKAEPVMISSTALRVRVPALEGAPGTTVPVSVELGGDRSNEAPFMIGHLPLLQGLEPPAAAPGELVRLRGRGFQVDPQRNVVMIGGERALVVRSDAGELQVMVPFAAAGASTLELRVPGATEPARAVLEVAPVADPVEWRFVAQPFEDVSGHTHVFLSTALGPAFMLSAAGNRAAAERAVEGTRRLNEAAGALRASLDADFRAQGAALELVPKGTLVLEATPEDAAAYSESLAAGARGAPLAPERLAQWWAGIAQDLVLILLRGQKPAHAAGLGAEGRILAEVHQAAQRAGRFGLPRQVVTDLKPAQRQALRVLAQRVPAALLEPAVAGRPAAGAGSSVGPPPLRLQGKWSGFESERGAQKLISVTFGRSGGTLTFTEGVSIGVPLLSAETPQRNTVRFSAQVRGGVRYYLGTWNGEKLSGRITTDPAGRNAVGSFELTRGL